MISATSLNAPSPLNKGHQIPLGLDNGRLRVDSQKFLVPSLPVSARAVGGHGVDPKRRERSIVNGTAHPSPPTDYSHHHQHSLNQSYQNHINGFRPTYHNPHSGGGSGGGRDSSSSPHNSNRTSSSPHHSFIHLNNSPRKDAHSPMYAGEVPSHSPSSGGNYSRSSMPIPCSSPAQASSASPKGSHSHSPSNGGVSSANYSPKLPQGPAMLPPHTTGTSELSPLATAGRLYTGFPPPHPSVAAHLSPAFYAAAAAAAASHSMPYPIFGPSYNPHSHSAAAASAYLDSFHSALVHRGTSNEIQQRSRSPSPSPPNRSHGAYHSAQPHPQQHQSHSHNGPGLNSHPSTSVTSLHNKLIESTSISSDRHGYNYHVHHHVSSGQFSPQSSGISKGGPLGISGGIMNLPSSRLSNGTSSNKHNSQQPENLVMKNGYHLSSKQWMELNHGLNPNDPMSRKLILELEARHNNKDNVLVKQFVPSQSPPQDMSVPHSPKISKTISFASDVSYPPNHTNMYPNPNPNNVHHTNHNPYVHINGHHAHVNSQPNIGILTDSNHAKKQVNNNNHNHLPNLVPAHPLTQPHNNQSGQFLPPSPKKRAAQWNFAVPANPASKADLPPPPPPVSHSLTTEQIKYLNSNQNLNHKPSNQLNSLPAPSCVNAMNLSSGQSAQNSYPSSPRLPGSGPSTPKSPAVHQVKFSFSSGSSKENLWGHKQGKPVRNDSSSSSSSNEGNVPWPVEQMPILEAFRRGSLIKLANGDLRPVEDLKAEDFIQAAANMSGSLKIIHCTVLSIQQSDGNNGNSLCKVTMTVGSQLQNQQVVVPSTPEQPFFVLGRGWSSLSPKTTEKLLQLPCSPLAVGDVCITLSKSTPQLTTVPTPKSQNPVPKSPSTRGRKPGTGRGGAQCPPTTKRHSQTIPSVPLKQASEIYTGKLASNNAEAIKRHNMGPPLTGGTTVVTSFSNDSGSSNVMLKSLGANKEVELDSLRPSSPKRRRWSAPQTIDVPPAAASDKLTKDKEQNEAISSPQVPSSPPPQNTPPCIPHKSEDERTIRVCDMRMDSGVSKTDVNSNLNVKDNATAMDVDQRGSSDAQFAKA